MWPVFVLRSMESPDVDIVEIKAVHRFISKEMEHLSKSQHLQEPNFSLCLYVIQ